MKPAAVRKFMLKLDVALFWVRWVYPNMLAYRPHVLFLYLLHQKVLLKNFFARWPVHSTSRVFFADRIVVGMNSAPGMSQNNYIQGRNGIICGDNVKIGPGVGIISANHDSDNLGQWTCSDPIVIGNNVWIGMNAVILPGVKIGDNVVIGAGSIVTKSIPPNCIAGGNPCRIIRQK